MSGTENEPVINAVSASPAGYLYEYASHVSARVHTAVQIESRSSFAYASNGYGSFKRASSPHPAVSFIIIHGTGCSPIASRVKPSYYVLVPTTVERYPRFSCASKVHTRFRRGTTGGGVLRKVLLVTKFIRAFISLERTILSA